MNVPLLVAAAVAFVPNLYLVQAVAVQPDHVGIAGLAQQHGFGLEEVAAQKYVFCLSTTPWRAGGIQRTIDSLMAQIPQRPQKIVLSVPQALQRPGESAPVALKDGDLAWASQAQYSNVLDVYKIPMAQDMGPATKLLGCLQKIPEHEDVCLIVTDDDRVKTRVFARILLERSCKTSVSGGSSALVRREPGPLNTLVHYWRELGPSNVMVHGFRGWAVNRLLVPYASVHSFWEQHNKTCFFFDDELFSGYFVEQGVQIDVLQVSLKLINSAEETFHGGGHPLGGSNLTGGHEKASACWREIRADKRFPRNAHALTQVQALLLGWA